MEKIPAACAVDWSIQLEKGLRSKKPGKSVEALKEIGCWLEWWNSEPELHFTEYKIFGLILGEDELFLNAIFLRLAEAFRLGNKEVKTGVVKLFLRMKRGRRKRYGEGILSKAKLVNYLELLTRVKEVFDGGSVEERALSLVLFGCWASIAKDCPDIHYILLSSLVSGDVIEVKAALFAAGCFCELSDDFANVFLEILTRMVVSAEIPKVIKLVGGRAFSRMWGSPTLSEKAYKTGLKILMDSSEDDFSVVMLISLTRIASRWMLLSPTQIDLLKLFLNEERSLHIQATSIRCQRFMVARGVFSFPAATDLVDKLFGILHRSEYSPTLRLEALKTLRKILLFNIFIIPCAELPQLFRKLLVVIENMADSSLVSARGLALSILSDISGRLLGRKDLVLDGTGSSLALPVISFVFDRILYLATSKQDVHEPDSATEMKSLFMLLFNIVEKHSYLCCLVLSGTCLFIDKLTKMLGKVPEKEKTGSLHNDISLVKSKFMFYLSKVLAACLENLGESDACTIQLLEDLKLQLQNVCGCNYFCYYSRVTCFLILHLHATNSCLAHMQEHASVSWTLNLPGFNSILELDIATKDWAKKMLERNSYWSLYKAGKSAACQGTWSTAALIFEQLTALVQSASCSSWLKSLTHFCNSEKEIQLFLVSDLDTSFVSSENNLSESGAVVLKANYCSYKENLLRAYSTLSSAKETVAVSDIDHTFSFQKWYLNVRAKFLKNVVDVMMLLDKIPFTRGGSGSAGQLESTLVPRTTSSSELPSLLYYSSEISCQMHKLARELDMLLVSFIGMDKKSRRNISAIAMSCSLIAFVAGFAFLIPDELYSDDYRIFESGISKEPLHTLLIEDLIGRLTHVDGETRENVHFLLKSIPNFKSCSLPKFGTRIPNTSCQERILHKLCVYSVSRIVTLQNEASQVEQDDGVVPQILINGSQLLLNITSKLMLIPSGAPRQFFRVRQSVSSELIVMNDDGENIDRTSILSGFHLSLNLCLQLKYVPDGLSLTKVYCILECKRSSPLTIEIGKYEGPANLKKKDEEIDDIGDLNEKLLRYMIASVECQEMHPRGQADYSFMVDKYVCFQLNGRGQGFSTCLLDVSAFPVGSYTIKWQSGFLDGGGSYWSLLPLSVGPRFTIHDVTAPQ